ncbi:Hypothetical predicted protein, partial [Pelobates cultripes]
MAAREGLEGEKSGTRPRTYPLKDLDRVFLSLCIALCVRVTSHKRATQTVASWLHPATRRCHFGLPLHTLKPLKADIRLAAQTAMV